MKDAEELDMVLAAEMIRSGSFNEGEIWNFLGRINPEDFLEASNKTLDSILAFVMTAMRKIPVELSCAYHDKIEPITETHLSSLDWSTLKESQAPTYFDSIVRTSIWANYSYFVQVNILKEFPVVPMAALRKPEPQNGIERTTTSAETEPEPQTLISSNEEYDECSELLQSMTKTVMAYCVSSTRIRNIYEALCTANTEDYFARLLPEVENLVALQESYSDLLHKFRTSNGPTTACQVSSTHVQQAWSWAQQLVPAGFWAGWALSPAFLLNRKAFPISESVAEIILAKTRTVIVQGLFPSMSVPPDAPSITQGPSPGTLWTSLETMVPSIVQAVLSGNKGIVEDALLALLLAYLLFATQQSSDSCHPLIACLQGADKQTLAEELFKKLESTDCQLAATLLVENLQLLEKCSASAFLGLAQRVASMRSPGQGQEATWHLLALCRQRRCQPEQEDLVWEDQPQRSLILSHLFLSYCHLAAPEEQLPAITKAILSLSGYARGITSKSGDDTWQGTLLSDGDSWHDLFMSVLVWLGNFLEGENAASDAATAVRLCGAVAEVFNDNKGTPSSEKLHLLWVVKWSHFALNSVLEPLNKETAASERSRRTWLETRACFQAIGSLFCRLRKKAMDSRKREVFRAMAEAEAMLVCVHGSLVFLSKKHKLLHARERRVSFVWLLAESLLSPEVFDDLEPSSQENSEDDDGLCQPWRQESNQDGTTIIVDGSKVTKERRP